MVLCEDDERRFGGGFLFCVEDFVGERWGGGMRKGKSFIFGSEGMRELVF